MRSPKLGTIFTAMLALLIAAPVVAQHEPGGGGGGGGGCGDVFGDLIHILRDTDTGQPILQKRWIEYPGDVYDWGYCPIAVDAEGNELGFADLSCDVAAADLDDVVEVDYFGRLNGGRTKVRNQRMHLNEVIENIKGSCIVKQDETGRLKMGFCDDSQDPAQVTEWAIVDSPMENMGVYVRVMKFGHLQSDPEEEDLWAHGDPATMPQYHPALGPEDWDKFHTSVRHLLPGDGSESEKAACFADLYACAQQEALSDKDFVSAAAAMAGAANKGGQFTVDLMQYFNRIVKIVLDTDPSELYPNDALATLPARIRLEDGVTIEDAEEGLPAPADERFVDYAAAAYERSDHRDEQIEGVFPMSSGNWAIYGGSNGAGPGMELLEYLAFRNGPQEAEQVGLGAMLRAASDSLRAIEFVHNYATPEDLGVLCNGACTVPDLEDFLEE